MVSLIFWSCILCLNGYALSDGKANLRSAWNISENKQSKQNIAGDLDIEVNINMTSCFQHFGKILEGSVRGEKWALQFLDSWGKLPSGILLKNVASLGNFDQCTNIHKNIDGSSIRGQYCITRIPALNLFTSVSSEPLLIGICIPSTCNVYDAEDALIEVLKSVLSSNITGVGAFRSDLCAQRTHFVWTPRNIFAIAVLASMVLLVSLSTTYEYYTEQALCRQNEMLASFSLIFNWRQLFKIERTTSVDLVPQIYGIRCLSMFWVLFSTWYYIKIEKPSVYYKKELKWESLDSSLNILRASYCIDTFLLLSGFLMAWCAFKEMKNSRMLNIPRLYVLRYLRLFPAFAVVVLICSTFYYFMGNGPLWNMQSKVFRPCETFWWSALTFSQNYINPNTMCLEHSWFLSVNMQLYILSPLILFLLFKLSMKFMWIIILLVAGCIACSYFSLTDSNWSLIETSKGNSMYDEMRYSIQQGGVPWLVGISLGYAMYSIKGQKMRLSKFIVWSSWILTCLLLVVAMLRPYVYKFSDERSQSTQVVLIIVFSRFLWSVCISWVLFACSQGHGGLINKILTLDIWQPLSRLCYSAYVLHMVVHVYILGTLRSVSYFSLYDPVELFCGYLGVITFLSIVMVIFIELPCLTLIKLFSKHLEKYYQRHVYYVQDCSKNACVANYVDEGLRDL